MNIYLYKFDKKENSTAVPSGVGTPVTGQVNQRDSSITNPLINFAFEQQSGDYVPDFNYAWIPAYSRYYWVSDWVRASAFWQASLNVDVLASFRTEIHSESEYVLRADSQYDGNITDTVYPASIDFDTVRLTGLSPWIHNQADQANGNINIYNGVFCIGVQSEAGLFGPVRYYYLEMSEFAAMTTYLFTDSFFTSEGFDVTDASLALQKSLVNPLSYITSCVWLPLTLLDAPLNSYTQVNHIEILNWSVPVTAYTYGAGNTIPYVILSYGGYTVPRHPQAAVRGAYLNDSPYASYAVNCPPFGVIDLNASIVANCTTLFPRVLLDMTNGNGTLLITADGHTYQTVTGQIGVPVKLSQVTRDYLSGAQNVTQGLGNIIGGLLTGNVAGAVSGALGGAVSAAKSLSPSIQSSGSQGSYAGLYGIPEFTARFYKPASEGRAMMGRPLYQVVQLGTLTGYCLCAHGDIACTALQAEKEQIKTYLTTGVYIE